MFKFCKHGHKKRFHFDSYTSDNGAPRCPAHFIVVLNPKIYCDVDACISGVGHEKMVKVVYI